MKKAFMITYGTYPFNLFVIVGMSPTEIFQYINRRVAGSFTEGNLNHLTLGERTQARYVLVTPINVNAILMRDFTGSAYDTACLAHEVFHAVHGAFSQIIGLVLSDDSEEAYSYEIQYLMEKILDKLLPSLDKKRKPR